MEKTNFTNCVYLTAIRDLKNGVFAYGNFQAYVSPESAKRAFEGTVANVDMIKRHPEDFAMYLVALIDTADGRVQPLPMPELIANATDFNKEQIHG